MVPTPTAIDGWAPRSKSRRAMPTAAASSAGPEYAMRSVRDASTPCATRDADAPMTMAIRAALSREIDVSLRPAPFGAAKSRPMANGMNPLHGASAWERCPTMKSNVGYFVGGCIVAPTQGLMSVGNGSAVNAP